MVTGIWRLALGRLALIPVLALLAAACGPLGASEDEQTPTAQSSEAQPTVGLSATAGTAAGSPGAPLPTNTDMSTSGGLATPRSGADAATPVAATPAAPGASNADLSSATPSAAEQPISDELTNALLGVASGAVGTPAASPAASTVTATSCEPQTIPPFTGATTSYVVVEDLNFRVGPGSDCEVIGSPLAAGSALLVTGGPVVREGEEGVEWLQVEVEGVSGWVAAEFVMPAT